MIVRQSADTPEQLSSPGRGECSPIYRREPPVRGEERLKDVYKSVHMNQKPLRLLEQTILASSDPGDVVWEPFGGLCSTAIAALNSGRQCYSAEILEDYYKAALTRLANHDIPWSVATRRLLDSF